jgi:hypothetical protein
MRKWLVVSAIVLSAVVWAAAQESAAPASPTGPPALSEIQRTKLKEAVLTYKLTQAEFKLAQIAAQEATQALMGLATSLQRDGYEFNLETMTYKPVVAGKKE